MCCVHSNSHGEGLISEGQGKQFVPSLITGLPFLFSLQETYEAKRNEFLGELQKKEEAMRQMFVQRVKEKEAELKEAEKEVKTALLVSSWLSDKFTPK